MSIHANSLRNVLVDSFSLTVLMTLAAVAVTAVAQGAEPRIERLDGQPVADRQADDHVDSRQNTDDNLPSGDPTESPEAKREAMMLGMTLFERSAGDIRVTDVAATSPAWDAGIRRGDRIHALDGVKPQRLSAWINDVGKILKNTEDGSSIAADIERDGELIDLRIRVPVSKAAEVRDARQEEQAIARLRGGNQGPIPQGQPGGQPIGYATDDRITGYDPGHAGYGGYGLGGFFDDGDNGAASTNNGDDRMATSAVAQLMAVNTLNRGGTQSSGGQVGIAGFQNSGDGVDAMVVVQGLPQGTYRVGIGQANNLGVNPGFEGLDAAGDGGIGLSPALEGTANGFDNPNVGRNQSRGSNNQQMNNQQAPTNNRQNQPVNPLQNQPQNQQQPGFVPPAGQTPNVPQGVVPGAGSAPGAGGTPAGGAAGAGDGASLANPRHAYLAQQIETQQPPQGAAQQPTNQQRLSNTGTTSQRESAQQTPQANPYDPRDVAQSQRQLQNSGQPFPNAGGSPFVAELGVLQVGPNGSGRVQNRLEGMAVRNLAGMSVIVESTNFQGAARPQNDPRLMQGAQGGQAAQQRRQAGQQLGQQNGQMNRGAQGVVATGVIQLRDGGNTAGATGQQAGPQQGREPLQGTTPQQRADGQISNPREQFNPSR